MDSFYLLRSTYDGVDYTTDIWEVTFENNIIDLLQQGNQAVE